MLPLLKKEKQQMFLWLKMSFWREKHNWKRQIFMYKITLEKSFSSHGDPEKVIYFGWLEALTTLSPSLLEELEIVQVTDHRGS